MTKKYWQDVANAVIGVWVFASAWSAANGVGGFAFWNLAIAGLLVAALAASAWFSFAEWKMWCSAVLGAWLLLSPLFRSGEYSSLLVWSTAICGILVIAFAAWVAGDAYDLLPKRVLAKGDMREGLPELALPDESEHMAGGWLAPSSGPDIVSPGPHVQAPGQTTKG